MEIFIGIIAEPNFVKASSLTNSLRIAVGDGDIDACDKISSELIEIVGKENATYISEKNWAQFNNDLRKAMPEYKSEYVIDSEKLEKLSGGIFNNIPDIYRIIKALTGRKYLLLQLPVERNL